MLAGITILLLSGLVLVGCTPEETAPATSQTEPSPGKETVVTPPAEEVEPATLTPIPETPTPAPAAIPAYTPPPRPDAPFVTKQEDILLQENFEDGRADGWALEEGWRVGRESVGRDGCLLIGCRRSHQGDAGAIRKGL